MKKKKKNEQARTILRLRISKTKNICKDDLYFYTE